uniref:Uncharacterized protein n=1 Tax=Arundo donax TaxID=35708 RepID=A0A0A9BPE0_ARUDO
MLASNLINAG